MIHCAISSPFVAGENDRILSQTKSIKSCLSNQSVFIINSLSIRLDLEKNISFQHTELVALHVCTGCVQTETTFVI